MPICRISVDTTPRCLLALDHEKLRVALEHRGRIVDRATLRVGRARLNEVLFEHRSAFESAWEPEPFGIWSSATKRFLYEVDTLVSRQLSPLLTAYQRVALHLNDSTLERLPIETAHQHGLPALFELMQVYRAVGETNVTETQRRRTFAVETIRGDLADLGAVFTEEALVLSQHRRPQCPDAERVVHVIGHDPGIEDGFFDKSERAHVVLSGCESLPKSLPDGVASATGTLWPIDDQTNAATVSLFHSRIGIGVAPVEALRQAQILQRSLPPVVWAAYAHVGQPDEEGPLTVQTPIQETPEIDGAIGLSEVRTGDIIFCAGPGPLQDLANRAGEPWRHVGIAIAGEEGTSIVEVAGPRFRARSLANGLGNVTDAAVGRIATADQPLADAAASWCKGHVDREQIYAWDDVILTGFIAATRRFSLAEDESRLNRMVTAAISELASRQRSHSEPVAGRQQSYSCSAFLVAAFLMVGYPLEIDLSLPRARGQRPSLWELVRAERRPLRSACGCRISAEQGLDTVRALIKGMLAAPENGLVPQAVLGKSEWYRWASPGDIWRSPTVTKRLALNL